MKRLTLEEFEKKYEEIFLEIGRKLEEMRKKDPRLYKELMELVY